MGTVARAQVLSRVVTASTVLLVALVLTPFVFFPLAALPYALALVPLVVIAVPLARVLRLGVPLSEPWLAASVGALALALIWAVGFWVLALSGLTRMVPNVLLSWRGLVSAALLGAIVAGLTALGRRSSGARSSPR